MDILILVALGVLIALAVALLVTVRSRSASGSIETSLKGIDEAKEVISDHAVRTIESIKDIGENLFKLVQQQEEAQKLGQSLRDLLQAPKLRGSYGETVLEEMLDRILPRGIWERQYPIDGRETVDCVVKYRDVVVPIDAKFPRDDYMRYLEAQSPEEQASCWRGFERAVRTQITSIAAKYVKPDKGTSEFALMFIPSEAIYYETIAEKNQLGEPSALLEFAQEHKVLPVGPNTFYAFLQVVLMGLRNVEIVSQAKRIQEGLSSLQRDFKLFSDRVEDIGKGIERASEAYRVGSGHIERYRRRLDETLQLEGLQDDAGSLSESGERRE
jgi:DNA recombination protein RmuC